jgi:hypothetical protein
MARKVIKVILIGVMVLFVAYMGVCTWGNLVVFRNLDNQSVTEIKGIPDKTKAEYQVKIVATGVILYTNEYKQITGGYVLRGYWDRVGTKYVYHRNELPLKEKYWGEIKIYRR